MKTASRNDIVDPRVSDAETKRSSNNQFWMKDVEKKASTD